VNFAFGDETRAATFFPIGAESAISVLACGIAAGIVSTPLAKR
jgi:hypothetical protein